MPDHDKDVPIAVWKYTNLDQSKQWRFWIETMSLGEIPCLNLLPHFFALWHRAYTVKELILAEVLWPLWSSWWGHKWLRSSGKGQELAICEWNDCTGTESPPTMLTLRKKLRKYIWSIHTHFPILLKFPKYYFFHKKLEASCFYQKQI